MMTWELLHPLMTPGHLGYLPSFLSEKDSRPAKEQLDERYIGGWRPFHGFKALSGHRLSYPHDPILSPLAKLQFREELIVLYQHSWVAIFQKDETFEVCRMD